MGRQVSVLAVAAFLAASWSCCTARSLEGMNQRFQGELTYYGGAGKGGSCTSEHVPEGFETVAMNAPQYDGGAVCGACVTACFTNEETGSNEECFRAIVDNKCPECKFGDLDYGKGGSGRWPVDWHFIPCPDNGLRFEAQGSNAWYGKVKAIGGSAGAKSMKCNGDEGKRTDDGYFEFWDTSGGLCKKQECDIEFTDGSSKNGELEAGFFGDCP